MGLDQVAEQKLISIGMVEYYEKNAHEWLVNAQDSYDTTKRLFPKGAVVRADDIRKVLKISVEVHPGVKKFLQTKRQSQKYWFDYFTDLAIERTWSQLVKGKRNG